MATATCGRVPSTFILGEVGGAPFSSSEPVQWNHEGETPRNIIIWRGVLGTAVAPSWQAAWRVKGLLATQERIEVLEQLLEPVQRLVQLW
jgi:hypothetical protein